MSMPGCRRSAASVSFFALLLGGAHAQTAADPAPLPDLVVTATRTPLAISQAGSAISVITSEEIARESPKSVANAFRRVPGLSVVETGGPGGTTSVRIRGGEARHTLVLIDGVRVNDPSSGSAEFDFANLVATDIERIEVLRGPQSALYGSDAMGGVINIITRKGKGAPRVSASVEGGSYGTKAARAAVLGSTGPPLLRLLGHGLRHGRLLPLRLPDRADREHPRLAAGARQRPAPRRIGARDGGAVP